MTDTETMVAFGASEAACYHWPGDSVDDRLCRAAFCSGAGWSAKHLERENERLKNVILDFIDMVDGKGSPPLPVIISQMRLFVESK